MGPATSGVSRAFAGKEGACQEAAPRHAALLAGWHAPPACAPPRSLPGVSASNGLLVLLMYRRCTADVPPQELHWYKIPKDLPIATAATMVIK